MKQKILINKELNLEQLQELVKTGSKFIVFQYSISLVFFTLRPLSKATFIEKETDFHKYRKRYNLISLIFGWWGLPWGPIYTISGIKFNNNSALDVTEDIMLNITEDSLQQNEVELIKTNQIFSKVNKSYTKLFTKAFKKAFQHEHKVKKIIIAIPLFSENGKRPPYIIGMQIDDELENYIEPARQALFKYFYKTTPFEFINLNEENETNSFLQ